MIEICKGAAAHMHALSFGQQWQAELLETTARRRATRHLYAGLWHALEVMLVPATVPVSSAFSKRRRMLRQQQSYHLFGVDADKSHHVPHALQQAVHVELLRG